MSAVNPDLKDLLSGIDDDVRSALSAQIEVEEKDGNFSTTQIPSSSSDKWMKLPEVVAVAFDLVNSTQLGIRKYHKSSARIYQSGVQGAVRSLNAYGADFIDIQGDGGFGLFWGDMAYERAFCAAITIKTFSLEYVERLMKKWEDLPPTGFKVGIHAAPTLVKKIGTPRNPNEQEAVWAGKPVNYAFKCAQAADAHILVVTETVWGKFKNNDFVVYSCGCSGGEEGTKGPTNEIWVEGTNPKLPEDENVVHFVGSSWCVNHGADFARAIMNGETKRKDIAEKIREEEREKREKSLGLKQAKDRQARRDRQHRI